MKFVCCLLMFVTGACYVQAQKLTPNQRTVISTLNEKAKEAIGNIRFFKGKSKVTIDDAGITATETGIKMMVVLAEAGFPKSTWTSEFNPAEILYINDIDMPKESPVGQLKITLSNHIGHRTSYDKKDGFKQSYDDVVYLNYLKVDKDNFEQIKASFFKLRDVYLDEANEALKPLAKMMSKGKDFWISAEGASKTYSLSRVYATGCTLRLIYHLQSIGTSGDKSQTYLTIIPMSEIDDVRLDKSKSRPNCILLESGKKGFETFEYKEKEKIYSPVQAVNEMPVFVDVAYDTQRDEVMEILKTNVKQCGGGKIKL